MVLGLPNLVRDLMRQPRLGASASRACLRTAVLPADGYCVSLSGYYPPRTPARSLVVLLCW